MYVEYMRDLRSYINIQEAEGEGTRVLCMLHENHFTSRRNLSPSTRIMAAMCRGIV